MKFQNPSIHRSKVNRRTHPHTHTDKPKAICPSNFFKVGGIKSKTYTVGTYTVGKQTLCKLSFAHLTVTSQRILAVQTKPKFRKFVVPLA